MDLTYIIKTGEINLKEGNRKEFERLLRQDIKKRLKGMLSSLDHRDRRLYLKIPSVHQNESERILSAIPGINAWARTLVAEKNMEALFPLARELAGMEQDKGAKSFKVESRRTDKSFPLNSYEVSRELGAAILDSFPGLKVDVHRPDFVVSVEIREKAYLYSSGERGLRGLPVNSTGKGLLLLSGGIDSPVAGFQMLKRGLGLEALHYSAWPYTSEEAFEKVKALGKTLAFYSGGLVIHNISLTEFQQKLIREAPKDRTTLYLRAGMIIAADLLARERRLNSIISGESLGQVASQTAENMRFSASFTDLPVFRPLVGMDKEDIIRIARQIGSYEISIQPFEDCCTLFTPKHPVLRADFTEDRACFASLGLDELIRDAVNGIESIRLPAEERR